MGVSIPMMIVQDENRADYAAGYHKHDAIEVRSWKVYKYKYNLKMSQISKQVIIIKLPN